jgi:hypothetical protein
MTVQAAAEDTAAKEEEEAAANANSTSRRRLLRSRVQTLRPGHISRVLEESNATAATAPDAGDGCKLGTEGVLCSQCSDGYNRDASVCTKCSDESLPLRLGIFLLIVGVVIAVMALFQRQLKQKWRRYQPLYRDVLRIFSIIITFQQISTSVALVIEVPWPVNFVNFMSYFKFVNIDIFAIVGVSCVGNFNFMMSFVAMCFMPVSIIIFAVVRLRLQGRKMVKRVANMPDHEKKLLEEQALHQLFHIVDTDGGGSINPEEFTCLVNEVGWKISSADKSREAIEALVEKNGTGMAQLQENVFVDCMLDGRMLETLKLVGATRKEKETMLDDRTRLIKWTLMKRLWANALAGATMLLMLAHTPVSRKVFQYFHCNDLAGKRYMFADYSVRCLGVAWWSFLPLILVVLFGFTLLLPGSISVYLYKKRYYLYTAKVHQKVGWLYASYKRGAEFWMVHDVVLKMILTGTLIYVPPVARPSVGVMICMIAIANLNYFRPHKTAVLFWLTQLTFLASGFKYVTALMISSSSHDPDATQEDIDAVGKLLIGIEILTFVSMSFGIVAAVYVLKLKLKRQTQTKARMRRVLKTHIMMGKKSGRTIRCRLQWRGEANESYACAAGGCSQRRGRDGSQNDAKSAGNA